MNTIPLTELDAVNMALDLIGEEPVSRIDTSGASDAAAAYRTLINESRAVQERGWVFNKECDYPLLPDTTNMIRLPGNTLFVDSCGNNSMDVAHRGARLYNRADHTYTFTGKVLVEIVFMLDFDELPSYARSYIAIRAARKFQKGVLGSDTLEKLTQEDEKKAYATMVSREISAGDYNFLEATDVIRARRRRP